MTFIRKNWQWMLFAILTSYNIWQLGRHVMWRDEMQAWLIASGSGWSLAELWSNMQFEPQPGLWHVILWMLSGLASDPFIMQAAHFLFGTATTLLVMRYAPFPAGVRLLIVMGYYLSFEYLLISRNYGPGVFLVFLFCAFYDALKKKPVAAGTVLGVLAHTSIFGAILSVALSGGLIADRMGDSDGSHEARMKARTYIVTLCLLLGVFVLTSLGIMLLSRGNYARQWHFTFSGTDVMTMLSHTILSMAPVPAFVGPFWNSLAIMKSQDAAVIIASIVVLGGTVLIALKRTGIGLAAYLFSFCVIGFLQYTKNLMYEKRYSGHLFILFLACLWLGQGPWRSEGTSSRYGRYSQHAFIALLMLNVAAAAVAGYYHATRPFSNAQAAAELIRAHGGGVRPVIGFDDVALPSVAGYLGRSIYNIRTGQPARFIRWDRERMVEAGPDDAFALASYVSSMTGTYPLFLLNFPMQAWSEKMIGKAEDAIVDSENYYLYDFGR